MDQWLVLEFSTCDSLIKTLNHQDDNQKVRNTKWGGGGGIESSFNDMKLATPFMSAPLVSFAVIISVDVAE